MATHVTAFLKAVKIEKIVNCFVQPLRVENTQKCSFYWVKKISFWPSFSGTKQGIQLLSDRFPLLEVSALETKNISGLYYKQFTIVIYYRNTIGQYYKTM
jgi:hypothetical protein